MSEISSKNSKKKLFIKLSEKGNVLYKFVNKFFFNTIFLRLMKIKKENFESKNFSQKLSKNSNLYAFFLINNTLKFQNQ